MRMKVSVLLLVCCALFAPPLLAQEQTGSIQGVVKDSSGAVLPGVTVEARSPQVVGVSTTVTDAAGIYRFPALPPGRYSVTATLSGFNAAKSEVPLALGQLLKVDLTLAVAAVTETVVVTAESPIIDVKQNASFATIQQDSIERLPRGRDFQTILKTAPGAQNEDKANGTQVDGASGSENRFILDGMDTTAPSTGLSGKTLLLDFIQEVQVKSSGYNAEFGGATGGVISAITKSGSNSIHGSGGTYYQSNKNGFWIGEKRKYNRYDPFNSNLTNKDYTTPDVPYSRWDPIGEIGGPILKNKLWYWAGAGYTKTSNTEDAIFYNDPNRVKRSFSWWSDTKYYNYNITTQLTSKMRLKFAGQNQRDGNRGTAPTLQAENYVFPDGTNGGSLYSTSTFDKLADGSVNQSAYDSRWVKQGQNSLNDVYSGNLDWVVTNKFFVNVASGYFKNNTMSPPEFRGDQIRHVFSGSNSDATMAGLGFPAVPTQYQQVSGFSDNISSFGTVRDKYTRTFVNANTTLFASMKGQHVFKAGARFERFDNDVLNGNAKPVITFYWGQKAQNEAGQTVVGKYGYYVVNQTGTIGKVESNNWSLWLQDSWTVNSRLTINAGVRAESETIPSYKKAADALIIKFGLKDKIAPRAGFAYDIKGDGRWKAYGSFGHYYTITPLNLARGSFGGDHWVDYTWTLDTPDWTSVNCGEGTTGCPGTFVNQVDYRHSSNQYDADLSEYLGRSMTGIDPNIKPVKTGEFTGGVDHEINPLTSIGVRYVHKWMFNTIEDLGVFFKGSELWLIGNPGENFGKVMEPQYPSYTTPKAKRNYDSVELKLKRRFSNNWSGEVSYLWSRLYGNYSGLTSGDELSGTSQTGRSGSPNATRYWDNTLQSYNSKGEVVYGLLPTDRPHVLKLQGTYDFKFGTQVGAFWIIESGTPQSTVVRMGGTNSASGYPVFVNGRGDLGRSPVLSQLDLAVSHSLRLGPTKALVALNIDNVFDQGTWTGLFTVRNYGPEPYRDNINMKMPPAQLYSGPYDYKAIAAAYTGTLRTNAFYTTPNAFQGRRQLRVSAKFTF